MTTIDPIREALMDSAWAAFVTWAFSIDKIRADFEHDTGMTPLKKLTPIDVMIDKACGVSDRNERAYIEAFTEWVTINHWGIDEAPEAYRKMMAEKKGTPTNGR